MSFLQCSSDLRIQQVWVQVCSKQKNTRWRLYYSIGQRKSWRNWDWIQNRARFWGLSFNVQLHTSQPAIPYTFFLCALSQPSGFMICGIVSTCLSCFPVLFYVKNNTHNFLLYLYFLWYMPIALRKFISVVSFFKYFSIWIVSVAAFLILLLAWGVGCSSFYCLLLLCYIFQALDSPPKTPSEADDTTLPAWKQAGSFRSRGTDGRLEQPPNKSLSLRKFSS